MDDKPEGRTIGERLDRLERDAAAKVQPSLRDELRRYWRVMTLYERFEQIVALVLSGVIVVVVAVAMVELVEIVVVILITEPLNPMQSDAFQLVFGMIMTLLIALEFKHSIVKAAMRREGIIQVRTVILIALLALARKFVVLDANTSPGKIAALAGALLALGIVHWLMRAQEPPRSRQKLD